MVIYNSYLDDCKRRLLGELSNGDEFIWEAVVGGVLEGYIPKEEALNSLKKCLEDYTIPECLNVVRGGKRKKGYSQRRFDEAEKAIYLMKEGKSVSFWGVEI